MIESQEVARFIQAARDVVDNVGSAFMDSAETFTCDEIEMIAELFRAAGEDGVADSIIESHAHGDDEGDAHYDHQDS